MLGSDSIVRNYVAPLGLRGRRVLSPGAHAARLHAIALSGLKVHLHSYLANCYEPHPFQPRRGDSV